MAPTVHSLYTLPSVSNDNGTASPRTYAVYRPANLSSSPQNLAPAMLVFYASGNCGFIPPGRFVGMSAVDRFVVVAMQVPCGRVPANWGKKNVDSPTPVTPDDQPYVAAVVKAITQCPSSGAGPNQCVDPRRIYAAGLSSGGNMAADIMCDAQNSSLFRGYLIDSASLQLFNGAPDCPSTNRSFFVMMAVSNYGPDSGIYYGTAPHPHLDVPQFADWAAGRLGCTRTRADDAIGSPAATTLRFTYSGPCAYAAAGSAAVVTLGVRNGAHGFGCQDSDAAAPPNGCPGMPNPPGLDSSGQPRTNGLFVEQAFWNLVARGISSSGPASPLAESIPPTVAVVHPANGARVSGVVSVSARATDDTEVAYVRFQLDGNNLGRAQTTAPTGLYEVPWATGSSSFGRHVLSAVARDQAGNSAIAAATITHVDPLTSRLGGVAAWVALGDAYAAGDGDPPYLPGTNSARNRCRRSLAAYPVRAAVRHGFSRSRLAFHACNGATVADFYRAARHDPEAPQRRWVDAAARVVTVTVGWTDASLPGAIRACARASAGCRTHWSRVVSSALAGLAGTSPRSPRSLSRLYRSIAAAAPHAKVVVVGYPRLFAASPPLSCRPAPRGPRLTAATMKWINTLIQHLDRTIQSAAARARVSYPRRSYLALAGHESCTRRSDVNGSLYPSVRGQQLLARLIGRLA